MGKLDEKHECVMCKVFLGWGVICSMMISTKRVRQSFEVHDVDKIKGVYQSREQQNDIRSTNECNSWSSEWMTITKKWASQVQCLNAAEAGYCNITERSEVSSAVSREFSPNIRERRVVWIPFIANEDA